ncbi:MAG: SMC-Scp complex subunit ScpB [Acidobacteriota bacterium]|nr:SMC-Scp complex subunit ScpB [Acidobacteriota bacterium]
MTQPQQPTETALDDNGAPAPLSHTSSVLKNVLESLIFVSDNPVSAKRLARSAHATIAEVQPLLDELVADYQGRGVRLYFVAGGYQFRSAADSSEFVKTFVAPKPLRLTRAQLETLAIVAYRQPITRPEVDNVRGVDSGSALRMLAERSLVKILGRKDEPGRPLVYGTTARFLEFFGLSTLQDLPTLQEFSDLTEEHKALFELRTGESIDLAAAEIAATEALETAERKLLEQEEAARLAAEQEAYSDDEEDDG